jgi:hypothetical protein
MASGSVGACGGRRGGGRGGAAGGAAKRGRALPAPAFEDFTTARKKVLLGALQAQYDRKMAAEE